VFDVVATNSEDVVVEEVVENKESGEIEVEIVEIIEGAEVLNMENEVEISIIDDEPVISESEEDIELEENIEEISFYSNIIGSTPAWAEEYLLETVEDINDLGEFLGAKLKFSMAIRKKSMEIEQNSTEEEADEAVDIEQKENDTEDLSAETEEPGIIETILEKILPEEKPEVIELDEVSSVEIESVGEEQSASSTEFDQVGEISFLDKIIKQVHAQDGDPKFGVWYMFGEESEASSSLELWQKQEYIAENELDNFSNKGYYTIDLDGVTSWEDLEKLQLKFQGTIEEHEDWLVYIDSVWIEVEYDQETEIEKLEKRQRWEEALDILSEELTFGIDKEGEFRFQYNKNEELIWETLGEMIGLGNFWQDIDLDVVLYNSKEEKVDVELTIFFEENGEFVVKLPKVHNLQPGQYSLRFFITDYSGDETEYFEKKQDFSWGVLAVNFDKSEYLPNDVTYVQLAVLDESGHTICDAELDVIVCHGIRTASLACINFIF